MPSQRKPPSKSTTHALRTAIKKGDVEGVSALIATKNLDNRTTNAAIKKCCLAPNAVALLDAFGVHHRPPHTMPWRAIFDLFLFACRHDADPSTVEHILQSMRPLMHRSSWLDAVSVAIQQKNAVLVGCIAEVLGDFMYDAPDLFFTKVIESADKEFAREVVHSPGVQRFLLDMERTFEPVFFDELDARTHERSSCERLPRCWVYTAIKNREMCDIVELINQVCPLVVGESLFLYGYPSRTRTSNLASLSPAMKRYARFNNKIKGFVHAIQAGDVEAVATQLEETSILVNCRQANQVSVLALSSTSPNLPALLVCFRQHLHKHDRGKVNIPATILCHVSANGGDTSTVAFLMDWLGECASRSSDALWDGIKQAMTKQHLPMFTHLLQVGRKTGGMDFAKLTRLAVESKCYGFALAMLESQAMHEYLGTLDPLDYDEEVMTWVGFGFRLNLPQLVECMERWSPHTTRQTMFVVSFNQLLPQWMTFRQRHVVDVLWSRARDSHLVVCRRLPGLRVLSSRVASYVVEAFVPNNEYQALSPTRSALLTRTQTLLDGGLQYVY